MESKQVKVATLGERVGVAMMLPPPDADAVQDALALSRSLRCDRHRRNRECADLRARHLRAPVATAETATLPLKSLGGDRGTVETVIINLRRLVA